VRLDLDIETDSKVVHGLKLENVGPTVSSSKFIKFILGEFFLDIFFVTLKEYFMFG